MRGPSFPVTVRGWSGRSATCPAGLQSFHASESLPALCGCHGGPFPKPPPNLARDIAHQPFSHLSPVTGDHSDSHPAVMWRTLGRPKRIPSCRPWRSQPPAGNSFWCLYKASVAECHALFLPRKSELHNYRAHALHVLQMEHRHLAPLISRLQTSHTIRSLVSMEPSCWPFLCSKHYCEGLAKS